MHNSNSNETASTQQEDMNTSTTVSPSPSPSTFQPRRLSKEEDETFMSAMDLSGVLNSSQISTSSGDSNHSSSSYQYSSTSSSFTEPSTASSSCVSSQSTSSSAYSTSYSHATSGESPNTDADTDDTPTVATVRRESTSTISNVRRCESWSALRSASVDSKSSKSETDSIGEMKSIPSASETYHTPSTSMHNISLKKSKSGTAIGEGHHHHRQYVLGEREEKRDDQPCDDDKDVFSEPSGSRKGSGGDQDSVPIAAAAAQHDTSGSTQSGGELQGSPSAEVVLKDIGRGSLVAPTAKQLAKAAKLAKPPKKKNWYQQIFSASYKSRSGDFKKLFKELPIKERLLVDYSCALQKEILVQGRMYLSQGYLSFHANIFGWETQTSIRLRDITSITKEKTALVIPNAIQIVTDGGEKLFFTSFVTRDSTFLMLFKLWQNALMDDSLPSKEMRRLILTSYGEELHITSDDENDLGKSPLSLEGDADLTDSHSFTSSVMDMDRSIVSSSVNASEILLPKIITGDAKLLSVGKAEDHHNGVPRLAVEPSDISDSSDSDDFQAAEGIVSEDFEAVEVPLCPIPHSEGKEVINAIIPCNIDQLFTMLFTNSKFYLDFHTSRKTTNINQSQWEIGKDGKQGRQVSMTVSVNAIMGPKHSQVTDTQIMDPVSKPGIFYVIDSETVNAGVPYADTFYVTVHYCLTRVSATQTKLNVVTQIKYRKSVWGMVKSIIEKNAGAGLDEFYSSLEKALIEECQKMILGSSPVPSPKHTTATGVIRRRPRVKRKAPDIPVSASSLRVTSRLHEPTLTVTDMAESPGTESSTFLYIVLGVLGCLLLLNVFLYIKLVNLEKSTTTPGFFPTPTFTFTGELPHNHQDWLNLLQKQEALHRIELQKWHEILISALKILHQAESDLEALKKHIDVYSEKRSLEIPEGRTPGIDPKESTHTSTSPDSNSDTYKESFLDSSSSTVEL